MGAGRHTSWLYHGPFSKPPEYGCSAYKCKIIKYEDENIIEAKNLLKRFKEHWKREVGSDNANE